MNDSETSRATRNTAFAVLLCVVALALLATIRYVERTVEIDRRAAAPAQRCGHEKAGADCENNTLPGSAGIEPLKSEAMPGATRNVSTVPGGVMDGQDRSPKEAQRRLHW